MTNWKSWALFCAAILFLMIGIHQTMLYGFLASYWLYMLSVSCLLYYAYKRKQPNLTSKTPSKETPKTTSKSRK